MELLNSFANFIERFPRLEILSLGDVLREFGAMMSAQTDLRLEASNLKKFGAKFIDDPWAIFPQPIDGFIKKNVIVETLMDGTPIINYMKLKAKPGDEVDKLKMKLSDLGTRAVLKMIFFDNFVHGDLHPGNMLVQFDEKTGEPRLVFLDCGIVYATKSEKDHQALVDVCISFMRHDGYSAGKHMIDNTKSTAINNADDFCKSIQKIVDDSADEKYFEHIGDYVVRVCDLARNHMVRLDPAYFHIAMTLKVVEGVSLSLNRDLDLVSKCIPIILKSQALRALGINKFPTEDEDNENIEDIKEKHNVKIIKRKELKNISSS
jgi:aarF domain-containing kinase